MIKTFLKLFTFKKKSDIQYCSICNKSFPKKYYKVDKKHSVSWCPTCAINLYESYVKNPKE